METAKQSDNARLAAIIALVAAFLVILVIVVSTLAGGDTESDPLRQGGRQGKAAQGQRPQERQVYVVKPSDCCLSEIAEKIGIELSALQELNPGLDPQAIQSGDRVKLR